MIEFAFTVRYVDLRAELLVSRFSCIASNRAPQFTIRLSDYLEIKRKNHKTPHFGNNNDIQMGLEFSNHSLL